MTTFITIIYIIVALIMILSILLQAGKGGGLGSALGGGASQGVFGGGGGADFMSKMTQGFAATFMICAMYLAYASAHAGSEFLASQDDGTEGLLEADEEIDYEKLGPRAKNLPSPEEGKAKQAAAAAMVPAQTEAPAGMIDDVAPPAEADDDAAIDDAAADDAALDDAAADDAAPGDTEPSEPVVGDDTAPADGDRGDSPDVDRGDSPHSGKESLQNAPLDDKKPSDDKSANGSDDQ